MTKIIKLSDIVNYNNVFLYISRLGNVDVFTCVIPGLVMWEDTFNGMSERVYSTRKDSHCVFVSGYSPKDTDYDALLCRLVSGYYGHIVFIKDGYLVASRVPAQQGALVSEFHDLLRDHLRSCIEDGKSDEYKNNWMLHTEQTILGNWGNSIEEFLTGKSSDKSLHDCTECWYYAQSRFSDPCRNCGNKKANFIAFSPDTDWDIKEGLQPDCSACAQRNIDEDDEEFDGWCGACCTSHPMFNEASFPQRDRDCDNCEHSRLPDAPGSPCINCVPKTSKDCAWEGDDGTGDIGCFNCSKYKNSAGMVICNLQGSCRLREYSHWTQEKCATCNWSADDINSPCRSCSYHYKSQYIKKNE